MQSETSGRIRRNGCVGSRSGSIEEDNNNINSNDEKAIAAAVSIIDDRQRLRIRPSLPTDRPLTFASSITVVPEHRAQSLSTLAQQFLQPIQEAIGVDVDEDDEFGRIIMEDAKRLLGDDIGTSAGSVEHGGEPSSMDETSTSSLPIAPESQGSSTVASASSSTSSFGQGHRRREAQPEKKKKRKRRPPLVPWKKPPGMPRRPLSAYNLYFKQRREELMREEEERQRLAELAEGSAAGDSNSNTRRRKKSNRSVGIGFANLAKTIASEWKDLSDDDRSPYEARALPEKQRYDAAMLVWRAKQKNEKAMEAATAKTSSTASSSSFKKKSSSSSKSPTRMDVDAIDPDNRDLMKAQSNIQSPPGPMQDSKQSMLHGQHALSEPDQISMGNPQGFNTMAGMAVSMMSHPMHPQQDHHQQYHTSAIQNDMQVSSVMRQHQFQLQQQQEQMQSGVIFDHAYVEDGPSMHGNFMKSQQQPSLLDHRVQLLVQNPSSRMAAMLGMTVDEYHRQTRSLPLMFGEHFRGNEVTESSSQQSRSLPQLPLPSGRRNTWSGLPFELQQEFNHSQELNERFGPDVFFEPSQQQRHQITRGNIFSSDSHGPAKQQRLGFGDITPENATNSVAGSHSPFRQHRGIHSAAQHESLAPRSSGRVYPDDWFHADTKLTDTDRIKRRIDGGINDELICYSPKGDLNQKLSATHRSLSSGSLPISGSTHKKTSILHEKHRGSMEQSSSYVGVSQLEPLALEASVSQQQSSLRTLGMQLDEESVNFLSNLRFGSSSDHSGSSKESN